MGGFPVGIAGKGMLMLSGGIDSPVAGYLAMKQGLEIECVHFVSTPLTSIESAQKVIDVVKKMAVYAPNSRIKVHFVPFKELHMELLDKVHESYNITIMRRMMYRIATMLCEKNGALCIVNGESVGQVASQTLGSMHTINSVTNIPVLRPVVTYDKNEIIRIARKIDTYEISIRSFEDCCTVYVPKNPATYPTIEKSMEYEKLFDYDTLVKEAVDNTIDRSDPDWAKKMIAKKRAEIDQNYKEQLAELQRISDEHGKAMEDNIKNMLDPDTILNKYFKK
jgi:thiamine biosynthesis protein ThiI